MNYCFCFLFFFFFKQKTAYEMLRSLVGSEMCIRDRPYLLVFAHQWDVLLAAYQDLDGGRVIDAVLRLLADGSAVGLRAVVTGDRATLLGRLAAVMSDRLLLQLADPADYGVVGLRPAAVPRRLARGRGRAHHSRLGRRPGSVAGAETGRRGEARVLAHHRRGHAVREPCQAREPTHA